MKRLALCLLFALPFCAGAQVSGLGTENWQLQQLIQNSEAQLKAVQEQLKTSQQDSKTLEAANKTLDKLTAGLDRSIEKFQGSKAYEQALLMVQAEDLKARSENKHEPEKESARFMQFQSETLQANGDSLKRVKALEESLRTAENGFVGKIQSQAALGNWQAQNRVSAQLAELLSAIHGLREDLSGKTQGPLALLVQGSEDLNRRQREAARHAK